MRVKTPETQIEPTTIMVEAFETAEDRFRREWATSGADYAWQILKFLQGHRTLEISLVEVLTTQTYARALQREKDSLRFVASQAEQQHPVSDEDRRRLIERDDFLIKFVAGETLGHGDWVSEIQGISTAVARAQAVDASLFARTYKSPRLFSWLWKAR